MVNPIKMIYLHDYKRICLAFGSGGLVSEPYFLFTEYIRDHNFSRNFVTNPYPIPSPK